MLAAQLPDPYNSPEQWNCWEVSFHQLCPAAHGAHSQRINPPVLLTAPKHPLCSLRFHHFIPLSSPAERLYIRTLGEQRVEAHSFSGLHFQPMNGTWMRTTGCNSGGPTLFLSDPKPKGQCHLPRVCCWLRSQPPWEQPESKARLFADLSWTLVPQGTLPCAQCVSQSHL